MGTSFRFWFGVLHYSRLLLCLLAMSLASAVSIILAGQIDWQAVAVVGLCTYSIYSLDNLIDWKREAQKPPFLNGRGKAYFIWCTLTIPPASLYASSLAIRAGSPVILLLGILTGVSLLHVILTQRPYRAGGIALWIEPFIVSLIWSLAIVFIPATMHPFASTLQLGRAYIFIWELSFIGALIRYGCVTSLAGIAPAGPPHNFRIEDRLVLRVIRTICVLMFLMVAYDTLRGYFPWYNTSLLVVPAAIFFYVNQRPKFVNHLNVFETLFYLGSIAISVLIAALYTLGERFA